jgi:protein phosphatase
MSLTMINASNIFQKDAIGKVRTIQEDTHDMAVLTPNGDVFVVCDGMGGHVGGKQASSIATKSIIEYLKKEKYPNPIQALNEALQFANMQILGYANEHPELKGMGTTACIVLLQDDEAYIAHAGDSRIYLYLGKERQLHRITKDHSFIQTLVDAGKITDEEAESHPNKNCILKALGLKPELQPTFNYQNKPILPKNGDVFLICSDGLSGMISDNTIQNVLLQNTTIGQKGKLLINLALQGENGQLGGQDNITVELIQIDSSPWKKSAFKSFNPEGKEKSQSSVSSSKNLKIILTAVLIAFLCIVGIGAAYKFSQKKSQEQKLEQLRIDRNSAIEKVAELDKQVKDAQSMHDKNAEKTRLSKNESDKNKTTEFAEAYDALKTISDQSEKELQSLKKQRDEANENATNLKDSFKSDSINIVNSRKK